MWAGPAQLGGRGHALIRAGALRRRQNKEVFGLSVRRAQAESGSESCSRGRDLEPPGLLMESLRGSHVTGS